MTVFVARSRATAIEHICAQAVGTIDLDYESAWQDALELRKLGERYGISVQFRTIEHIAVRTPEALSRGLRAPKGTFRQRHLYCMFDLMNMPEPILSELEARAIQHGDYILAGHLMREATLAWE